MTAKPKTTTAPGENAPTNTDPVALPTTEATEETGKTVDQDGVYEPSDTVTEHNPYDTKVGGKPACTLADGTVPQTVKQTASKA